MGLDLFDIVTWRSPLRNGKFRPIFGAMAKLLVASSDPQCKVLGLLILGLLKTFERKVKK